MDAIGLTRLLAALNSGLDYSGKAIDDATSFHIGVAVNPVADDPGWELERFHQKIEAGARFAMTQVLFDAAQLERFLDRLDGPAAGAAAGRRLAGAQPRARVPAAQRGARASASRPMSSTGSSGPARTPPGEGLAVARDLLAAVPRAGRRGLPGAAVQGARGRARAAHLIR